MIIGSLSLFLFISCSINSSFAQRGKGGGGGGGGGGQPAPAPGGGGGGGGGGGSGGQPAPAPVPAPVPAPPPNPPTPVTAAQIASLSSAIVSAFGLVPSYGTPCNLCAQGIAIGGLLRLGFHDAAGIGSNTISKYFGKKLYSNASNSFRWEIKRMCRFHRH